MTSARIVCSVSHIYMFVEVRLYKVKKLETYVLVVHSSLWFCPHKIPCTLNDVCFNIWAYSPHCVRSWRCRSLKVKTSCLYLMKNSVVRIWGLNIQKWIYSGLNFIPLAMEQKHIFLLFPCWKPTLELTSRAIWTQAPIADCIS